MTEEELKARLEQIEQETSKRLEGVTDPEKREAITKEANELVEKAVEESGLIEQQSKIEQGFIVYRREDGRYGMMALADTEPMDLQEQMNATVQVFVNLIATATQNNVMGQLAMMRQVALNRKQQEAIRAQLGGGK